MLRKDKWYIAGTFGINLATIGFIWSLPETTVHPSRPPTYR